MIAATLLQMFALICLTIIVAFVIFRYFLGVGVGAPYLPIHTKYLDEIFELLEMGPGITVMDLGSGDGKILIEAAKRGANVIGYEINPLLAGVSKWRLRAWRDRATIHRKNLFKADLSRANVIFVFGITGMMDRLSKKLVGEAKPDATIISFAFPLPGLVEKRQAGIARMYRVPEIPPREIRDEGSQCYTS